MTTTTDAELIAEIEKLRQLIYRYSAADNVPFLVRNAVDRASRTADARTAAILVGWLGALPPHRFDESPDRPEPPRQSDAAQWRQRVTDSPLTRIEVEGLLVVTETDSGFLPDRIEIGGIDITKVIAELYGLKITRRGWHFLENDDTTGAFDLGMVRLTMEKLSTKRRAKPAPAPAASTSSATVAQEVAP